MLRHDERLGKAREPYARLCSPGLSPVVRTFHFFDMHLLVFKRKRLLQLE